ncbi:MAG: hypothetical protein LBT12_06540, partial [Oscillospiraceae bacterium]|nr:hypothetical protein [Oscillospiraceae bacterium]
ADVTQSNINGRETLEKLYELEPEDDPNSVIDEPFEKDGFIFNPEKIRFEEIKNSTAKDARQTVTVVTQTDDPGEILKRFSGTIPYTDEAGCSGTLTLDTVSILTEAEGYDTQWYSVTDTKEFFSMLMNDPAGIPQSIVKNGVTLSLKNIDWVVTGTSLAGDSLVPTEYKAVASYAGSYSKQVPTGYVTTAGYTGQIALEYVEKLLVSVTYTGTPIAAPEQEPEPEPAPKPRGANPLAIIGIVGALILGGAAAAILFLRKPQIEVSCRDGAEYVPIGKLPLNPRHPVIDMNGLTDKLATHDFTFALDKKTADKLNGQRVAVLLGDSVLKHTVDTAAADETGYKFNINFGGNSYA